MKAAFRHSTHKTGTSAGINFGLVTIYEPGSRFYGLDISIYRRFRGGTLNGVGLASMVIFESHEASRINGLEITISSVPTPDETVESEGGEFAYFPSATVNGFQFSLIVGCAGPNSNVVQIGWD